MSQSRADAQRIINNIINNDKNCRKAWPDFNIGYTMDVKEKIDKFHSVTDGQLFALPNIHAGWIKRINDFNFINPMNNQIVSANKNKIHTYHKVVKSSKQIISKNQRKINAFFTKA